MKLLTVNMEGVTHLERIKRLIIDERPETICLQEAPETFTSTLHELGYTTCFTPMIIRQQLGQEFLEGVMIASQYDFTAESSYYYRAQPNIVYFDDANKPNTISHPILLATITTPNEGIFTVTTTHVMVTIGGKEDEHQQRGVAALLAQLASKGPHILCGDFNMPRGYNRLYPEVCRHYTDTIPAHYQSSLDRNLHRHANNPNLNQPIFDIFMVDYIFTQPPYVAQNVRLQFGVSDHAAVIANITKR